MDKNKTQESCPEGWGGGGEEEGGEKMSRRKKG